MQIMPVCSISQVSKIRILVDRLLGKSEGNETSTNYCRKCHIFLAIAHERIYYDTERLIHISQHRDDLS